MKSYGCHLDILTPCVQGPVGKKGLVILPGQTDPDHAEDGDNGGREQNIVSQVTYGCRREHFCLIVTANLQVQQLQPQKYMVTRADSPQGRGCR